MKIEEKEGKIYKFRYYVLYLDPGDGKDYFYLQSVYPYEVTRDPTMAKWYKSYEEAISDFNIAFDRVALQLMRKEAVHCYIGLILDHKEKSREKLI